MSFDIIGWAGLGVCWIGLGILGSGKWMYWQIKVNRYPMSNNEIRVRYVLYTLLGPIVSFTILGQKREAGQRFPWRWINNFS